MKNRLPARCIDINTPYCPCILAETNNCVYCSHLKGETVCNCSWTGVCILNERTWQATNAKKKWRWEDTVTRSEIEAPVIARECIAEHTYHLKIAIPSNLAQQLEVPGSFIFLRRAEDPEFFKFPVGIMNVHNELIEVVIETIGPKSVRILENASEQFIIRGPYYNGVFGLPWIEKMADGKAILVAGGMGQPPAVPIAKAMARNGNKITAIVAPGKIGKIFIEELLNELGIEVNPVPSMRREGMAQLREWIHSQSIIPDLIVSAGPDDQHYGVINVLAAENRNIPMAATNNAAMCCGEGVCGSCDKETRSGKKIRTCKVQTDFISFT